MDVINTILYQKVDDIKQYFTTDITSYTNILIFTNMNPTGLVTIYRLLSHLSKTKKKRNVLIVVGEGDELTIKQKIKYMYIVSKHLKYLNIEVVGGIPDDTYKFPVTSTNRYPIEMIDKYFKYELVELDVPIISWPASKSTITSFLNYGSVLCVYIKQLYELIELLEVWPKHDITFHIYSGFYVERLIANNDTIECLLKTLINDSNLSINLYDYARLDIKGSNVIQKEHLKSLPYDIKQIIQNYNCVRLQESNIMEEYKALITMINSDNQKINDITFEKSNGKNVSHDDFIDDSIIHLFALEQLLKDSKTFYGYRYNDTIINILENIAENLESLNIKNYFHRNDIVKLQKKVDDYLLIAKNNGLFYLNLESIVCFNLLPNKKPKKMISCHMKTVDKKMKYIKKSKSRTKLLYFND